MPRSKNYQHMLEHAKDHVINSIGETMDLYGMNRSVGNLYGTMVFGQQSMTLDEMRNELQMSKPSMSAGVKKLQEFDAVKQQFIRGSRKQHFVAEKDFFTFFGNYFSMKWNREIKLNMEAIRRSEDEIEAILNATDVDAQTKEEAQIIYNQIEHSKSYYKWLSSLSNALTSGEIYDYFPIPDNN
ncbi:GbsR/MarR family transcriptional regulator [Staphylococcus sp. SQ8-PEA]|uniref:HTH-type transcriptional regulator n=1 Tax=Staphylococcus marylandisciuri TaxID=2981529 RepID=A0ABT2QMI2_9STAP|nr:GbsR/MarR family transcriptional regulator [Staphylococcus marylandisciuri]MCU5745184.1 GbsR/MarR family transcriptional regulator [Staphylococcus marylandisciuri]